MTGQIKIICTVLLVICLFLPLSSCTKYIDPAGKIINNYDPKIHTDAKRLTTYNYPLDHFEENELYRWLLLFCFLWPIPILIYRFKGKHKLIKKIIWYIEPLCVIGACWFIYLDASFLAEPFIGAYLSISLNCVYGITWLFELCNIFAHNKQR